MDGTTPSAEVYIDGKLTDIGPKFSSSMTVNRILINLDSWGIGETKAYVDDITVSNQRLDNIQKPASLIEEEEETTVFTDDFESYTAGTMATNDIWTVTGADGNENTVNIVELNGNQVLKLDNVKGTNIVMGVAMDGDLVVLTKLPAVGRQCHLVAHAAGDCAGGVGVGSDL